MSLKGGGILVLASSAALALGLYLGIVLSGGTEPLTDGLSRDQERLFAEVMARVRKDYVEPVDDDTLFESAIHGMVADLDPYSQFLDADEFRDIRATTSGHYSGVGIEVSTREGALRVIAPIDGTPADRAGIESGDRIVSVDGVAVDPERLSETIDRMRGRPGTSVILTVARETADQPLTFNVERQSIDVLSVRFEMLEPYYGYVRISQFNDSTPDELRRAIDELLDEARGNDGKMLNGMVLDLRNNPGGVLDAAVEVSDMFLDEGVIVSADGRAPEARFTRRAHRGDILDGAPMAVLVNEGSASASEIVAGALKDHGRALIVGTPTYGKAVVQTVMPLSEGRAIKLTTSRYYTPSGKSIHDTGIAPDVFVEGAINYPGPAMSARIDRDKDTQLGEALLRLQTPGVRQSQAM